MDDLPTRLRRAIRTGANVYVAFATGQGVNGKSGKILDFDAETITIFVDQEVRTYFRASLLSVAIENEKP